MGAQNVVQCPLDTSIQPVPTRIDRVQSDELGSAGERPVRGDKSRESRFSGSGTSIDHNDGIRCSNVDHSIYDLCGGTLKRLSDRIAIS